MYRLVVRLRFVVQVFVLNLSYALHRGVRTSADSPWAVGPYEIAGLVHRLGAAVPSVKSVVLALHPFFSFSYGWSPSTRSYPGATVLRSWLLGPWKLGELARSSRGLIYVGSEGFINSAHDHRSYEFRFLQRHGLKIVCYFTGNDIRSPRLMKEMERESGRPNLGTYLGEVNRVFSSAGYDEVKKKIAEVANRYADSILNADVDQRSYLDAPSHPFLYFHPDADVVNTLDKFDHGERPVILHAPSAPILKGTPLVRAAIDQLRDEGYDFEYLELSGVPHEQVRAALEKAHIVLNQFYAYVPGVFGVEAMAAGCAVLSSADEHLDPQLPAGSNKAWLVTEHHHITANLRSLLDDPTKTREFATAGRSWVLRHAVASVSGAEITKVLNAVLKEK